jgi:photosystem I subunit 11
MTMDMISAGGDPQVGNLSTPINGSEVVKAYINNLPAYRPGLSASNRGLEVGMAHGYFLYGPFALLGPMRATEAGPIVGLLAAVGLVSILTIALALYVKAGVSLPSATHTTPEPPAELGTKQGWSDFASGFWMGGCSGAFFAYVICQTPHLLPLQDIVSGVWSS